MSEKHSWRYRLAVVLAGGFWGAIARYMLSLFIQSHLGKGWPYDILLINVTGALVLALVTTLADATLWIGPTRRLFINVGFLGAYTTFSSLALGDILLLRGGQIASAGVYLACSLLGGVLAVLLGDWLGQLIVTRVRHIPTRKARKIGTQPLDLQDDVLAD